MTLSRSLDTALAAVIAFMVISIAIVKGDALYLGLWYYFVVPMVVLGISAALRTKPLFIFGTSLALAVTFVSYMAVNWRASRPEGLLALGHVFSLPGAVVGVFISAALLKRKLSAGAFASFLIGAAGFLGGFFANQLLVCNTVFWCGPLSLPVK